MHHTPILTNCRDSGTTRVNGSALGQDERVVLHHSDKVELGHLDEYSGDFDNTLAFIVRLSSSPPIFHHRTIPADALLSTTSSVFAALQSAEDTRRRLHEELTSTQQKLQAALKATAEHICVPPSPPRPYGTLLADLRGAVDDITRDTPSGLVAIAAPMSSPTPSSTPSASRPASPSPVLSASVVPTSSLPPSFSSRTTTSPSTSTADSRAPTVISPSTPGSAPSTPPSSSRHTTAPSLTPVNPSSTLVLTSVPPSDSTSSSTIPPPSGTSPSTSVLRSELASACTSPSSSASSPPATSTPTSSPTSSTTSLSASTSTSVLTSVLMSDPPLSSTTTSSMSHPADGSRPRKPTFVNNLASVIGAKPVVSIGALSLTSAMKAVETIRGAWLRERASTLRASHTVPEQHFQRASGPLQLALDRIQQAWTDVRAPVIAAACSLAAPTAPTPALDCPCTPVVEPLDHCAHASLYPSSSHTSPFLTPPTAARRAFVTHHGPCTTAPRCPDSSAILRVLLDGLQLLLTSSSHAPL
ncbi:hypothetical protein CF326_g9131 [Tilletia indica]|nr:hypothetical protein CF326_g9131 [Tilletia indica]